MLELVITSLAFIGMLSVVVHYLWQTPAQQQPVTVRQTAKVSAHRHHREV